MWGRSYSHKTWGRSNSHKTWGRSHSHKTWGRSQPQDEIIMCIAQQLYLIYTLQLSALFLIPLWRTTMPKDQKNVCFNLQLRKMWIKSKSGRWLTQVQTKNFIPDSTDNLDNCSIQLEQQPTGVNWLMPWWHKNNDITQSMNWLSIVSERSLLTNIKCQ